MDTSNFKEVFESRSKGARKEEMKYAAIGFIAFITIPVWLPLFLLWLFYDAYRDCGEAIVKEWKDRK